ncbi:MobH family relaxase [Actimicrobium sp. CCI2.3]|uniref:MobH family relaxase n=1 Tax=Actimicrobium sp. CCI2.3 TaxID=3048616 RepID=UPI002AB53487|nr:MobH family relaxase [Actimicrobium sp. CCI2.3]MDY7574430.1 MobH family relaxase [Actimicrobium sp. CCI2.3]MEB0022492.1 MobH family relaxase [Actimicrobium sp. CCI2.3]
MFSFPFFLSRREISTPSLSAGPASHDTSVDKENPPLAIRPSAHRLADSVISLTPLETLLTENADLLRRIKLAYGTDEATYQRDILAVICRFAAYVHQLPATADNYFSSQGGLLRMSLEIGFYALQATDSHIFSGRMTITKRRHLEPRWRHATFIAGLCGELHRTLSHLIVLDESGAQWHPYLEPLEAWLATGQRKRYFLRWLPEAQEVRALGVFALPHIVPKDMLANLADDNGVIVPHLMACVSGMPLHREANVLEQLVRRATALVIERDLSVSADRGGKPHVGAHLERYLLDAMRRLIVSSPAWNVNAEKSRVWFDTDGLYLVWPNVASDIVALLEADRLAGMPSDVEAILAILDAAGILDAPPSGESLWTIRPPASNAPVLAVRLSSPAILLSALDHEPKPLHCLSQRKHPFTAVTPEQSELELTVTASSVVPDSPPAKTVRYALEAPVRLNPAVKQVLAEIVATMNCDEPSAAACVIAEGVFIPLCEFESRQRETALVIRALHDCAMLVVPGDGPSRTVTRRFRDQETTGVVIHPRFIPGVPHDADPQI